MYFILNLYYYLFDNNDNNNDKNDKNDKIKKENINESLYNYWIY
jgi:hypothetical protein